MRSLFLPVTVMSARSPYPLMTDRSYSLDRSAAFSIETVTPEKVRILQDADAVLRDEMDKCGYADKMSQFFAVLPGVKTVGVMGDGRTYDELIAIRAVTTVDFMTADWAHIPYEILGRVSNRIINEVSHVNRVVYDITSKPPGTVEWE